MQAVNWQQFGLRGNPYDTEALTEGGELLIERAFVGREKEREFIEALFSSENRVALAICGDTGVGKTSLANFEKYLWKNSTPKFLFSFRREIEASEGFNKKNFLIEIIASVLREIQLVEPELLRNVILDRLNRVVDITQSLAITAEVSAGIAGYQGGIGFSRSAIPIQPLTIATSALEGYFFDLLRFVKENEIGGKRYAGLVVHINNLDIILAQDGGARQVAKFFDEIRDILQTRDVFFLFLGPRNFYHDIIAANQRVKSIFWQSPLVVEPLSKTEVVSALKERMNLLRSPGVQDYIKPIDDEAVFKIYDLYEGDIRSIMTAIRDILGQFSDRLAKPLNVREAMLLLGKERWERIVRNIKLHKEQREILKFLVTSNRYMSQKDVAEKKHKKPSNVSSYYFKPLVENEIIEEKERQGKTVFYGLTADYEPLQWFFEAPIEVNHQIKEAESVQRSLFGEGG
jgi:Cdc6-like AAA superfamily ATPase